LFIRQLRAEGKSGFVRLIVLPLADRKKDVAKGLAARVYKVTVRAPKVSSCSTLGRRARALLLTLLLTAPTGTLACASAPKPQRPVNYAALAAAELPGPPVAPERMFALLLNGGGDVTINYASHLAHLRGIVSLLSRAGVARGRISILSSDGDAPAADLAVGESDPEGSWLLAGTDAGRKLQEPTRFESSSVPGFALRPATFAELRRWFPTVGAGLVDGDTLLLYVTDHGSRAATDVMDTGIILWGKGESVSVRELRDMLRELRPGVRVVTLMSQCYSGGFAWLSRNDGEIIPRPNVCGYFSSRYDLMAYGCYTKLSGQDEEGHSFAFLRALARTGKFEDAHQSALVTDHTPDVPLRTSDLWLQELLSQLANSARLNVDDLIDALLTEAWKNGAAWEPEMRLLDRIGHTYGFASQRSLREMQALARRLSHVRLALRTDTDASAAALAGATQHNLTDFLAAEPSWAPRLDEAWLAGLAAPARRELFAVLLPALSRFTARGGDAATVMKSLSERADTGEALIFRVETRLAALIRMGAVLSSIAGRVYLGSYAEPQLLEAYRAMRACEGLTLPSLHGSETETPEPPPHAPK